MLFLSLWCISSCFSRQCFIPLSHNSYNILFVLRVFFPPIPDLMSFHCKFLGIICRGCHHHTVRSEWASCLCLSAGSISFILYLLSPGNSSCMLFLNTELAAGLARTSRVCFNSLAQSITIFLRFSGVDSGISLQVSKWSQNKQLVSF
jgi:hypothetical protein